MSRIVAHEVRTSVRAWWIAAALMERFGVRRVVALALAMVSLGAGLTMVMTQAWQL